MTNFLSNVWITTVRPQKTTFNQWYFFISLNMVDKSCPMTSIDNNKTILQIPIM